MNGERVTEVAVPHLAESLVSATVGKWLKHPGDYVREYEVLCELMTDKVNVEMPSPVEGIIVLILVGEGESAGVGTPICLIREPGTANGATDGSDMADMTKMAATVDIADTSDTSDTVDVADTVDMADTSDTVDTVDKEAAGEAAEGSYRSRYSPAVLRLAKELKLELRHVKGTGLGGRISRKDVVAYAKSVTQYMPKREAGSAGAAARAELPAVDSSPSAAPAVSASTAEPIRSTAGDTSTASTAAHSAPHILTPVKAESLASAKAESFAVTAIPEPYQDQRLPASPLRNLIATRMRQSVAEIPHAWMTVEADVTHLVALRQTLKDRFASKEGVRLTYVPFVLKAIVNAIKDFPMLNSTWSENTIIVKKDIHLSIAVGSEESIVTPVIRHADRKTIAGLAIELDDLVKRTRAGKLALADLQGGTFTFNNTGAFGSVLSQPIINYPQAAILTFEAIVRKPVVIHNDAIAIRSMANLCLSLDHRILDGMICGRFLQRVKSYLEQYDQDAVIY